MQPLVIDWERVGSVRVRVEKGTLQFRFGTTDAVRNRNYDPRKLDSGDPYHQGRPILWPADYIAQAGDKDRESFVMPAETAKDVFGHWDAPREEGRGGLKGFTLGVERERVAAFWGGYKRPRGDGTMHPPMNRLGPPVHMPHVTITLLDRQFRAIKGEDGREITIRPRDFYEFDEPSQYDIDPAVSVNAQASLIEGLTTDELAALRELVVQMRASNGKKSA